jgi:hypothetical protein
VFTLEIIKFIRITYNKLTIPTYDIINLIRVNLKHFNLKFVKSHHPRQKEFSSTVPQAYLMLSTLSLGNSYLNPLGRNYP